MRSLDGCLQLFRGDAREILAALVDGPAGRRGLLESMLRTLAHRRDGEIKALATERDRGAEFQRVAAVGALGSDQGRRHALPGVHARFIKKAASARRRRAHAAGGARGNRFADTTCIPAASTTWICCRPRTGTSIERPLANRRSRRQRPPGRVLRHRRSATTVRVAIFRRAMRCRACRRTCVSAKYRRTRPGIGSSTNAAAYR